MCPRNARGLKLQDKIGRIETTQTKIYLLPFFFSAKLIQGARYIERKNIAVVSKSKFNKHDSNPQSKAENLGIYQNKF